MNCMVSLLDIIGPVMVGPSSSHTAGACRLALLAREKDDPGFPRRFFLSRSPCPLLEAGLCGVYAHRPLACRGVLTDEDPAYCDPENPHPAPIILSMVVIPAIWRRSGQGFDSPHLHPRAFR